MLASPAHAPSSPPKTHSLTHTTRAPSPLTPGSAFAVECAAPRFCGDWLAVERLCLAIFIRQRAPTSPKWKGCRPGCAPSSAFHQQARPAPRRLCVPLHPSGGAVGAPNRAPRTVAGHPGQPPPALESCRFAWAGRRLRLVLARGSRTITDSACGGVHSSSLFVCLLFASPSSLLLSHTHSIPAVAVAHSRFKYQQSPNPRLPPYGPLTLFTPITSLIRTSSLFPIRFLFNPSSSDRPHNRLLHDAFLRRRFPGLCRRRRRPEESHRRLRPHH